MSLIKLREYQQEALEAVCSEFQCGSTSQLIVLPTGAGKTILMAAIAKHFNRKLLLLAHREELIQQAYDKFKLYWPEADIGICKAERMGTDNQIVIGSVQSCSRPKRLEKLKTHGFDILMIDEAHHAAADSYQAIVKELGFKDDRNKLLIGVTATPNRADKQGLGHTFEKITFSRSIATMIKAGYLSPAAGRKILTNLLLKGIKIQNGDFSISDLAEAVNTENRNAFVVGKYKAYASERKGVAFCADVKHCQDLAAAFNKEGIAAKAIWGDMPADERKQVIEELKIGKIQVATSCGVLTEGFDEPSISCIAMARPTRSHALYVQCVGRGLRLWPGKQDCLVLDFTDSGHNLDSIMSLSRTVPEAKQIPEPGEMRLGELIDNTPKIEILEECDKEFDILGAARFIWVPIGDNEWSLMDDEKKEIVIRPEGEGYVAALFLPDGSSKAIIPTPIPLEYCSGICEDYARRHLKIAFADTRAPWMSQASQPTQGQKDFLSKNGAFKEGMSKAEASIEIRKIIALKNKQRRKHSSEPITVKQKFALECKGINTSNMTKFDAMRTIAKLKQEQLQHA